VRDLSDGHTAPPFAPNRPRRARHTSDHTRQPILCRRSAYVLRVSVFSTTTSTPVIPTIPDRRPTCSPHGDIYATSTARLRRPSFGRAGSPNRCPFPVHTRRERQGPAFEHRGSVRVAWHQPHRRDRATTSRRLFPGQRLMGGCDCVSDMINAIFQRKNM